MSPDGAPIELRHLRALVAVAGQGTLTDAAIALGVSQPAVSRTLAQLEERLGVRLVLRTTRRLELTAQGQAFHRAAVRALASVDDATAEARGGVRPLRLGFTWSAAGQYTAPLLRAWQAEHPQIAVQLLRHDERTGGLADGHVDLALVRVRLDPERYELRELFRQPRFAVLPDTDPLAGRSGVRLADLSARKVAISSACGSLTPALWADGERPQIVADLRNLEDWLVLISSGQAIGISDATTAHQYPRPGIRYVRLVDAPLMSTWLAWDRRLVHPWQDRFIAVALRIVREVDESTALPLRDQAGSH